MENIKCKYCGQPFTKKGLCVNHETYYCKDNPNKKERKKPSKKIVKEGKKGGWDCICGSNFRTRQELFDHRKICEKYLSLKKEKKNCANPKKDAYVCPFCKKDFFTIKCAFSKHKKSCIMNPNRIHYKGHSLTEEEKINLSIKRKEWLKANPDKHPWKSSSKFKSVPCEHLKEELKNRGYSFLEEQNINGIEQNYSIDILFPDAKIGIEINGNQHYDTKNWQLLPYYQNRHDIIEAAGIKLIEVHYTKVYNEEFIMRLCSQLDDKLSSKQLCESLCRFEPCQSYYSRIEQNKKNKKIFDEKAILENQIDSNGKINRNILPLSEMNRRKELIINSNIDLTKFGWVDKVSNVTNLSKHQIKDTVDYFNLDVFRRK